MKCSHGKTTIISLFVDIVSSQSEKTTPNIYDLSYLELERYGEERMSAYLENLLKDYEVGVLGNIKEKCPK